MQNTDEKTKSKLKNIIISAVCILAVVSVFLISLGNKIGLPDWNDVFAFCGIYADLGDGISLSFINVGSADACYIKCRDKNVLIDAGTSLSYDRLWAYLKRNNCDHFDAIIVSHPDSDHIGSLSDVIKDFGTDVLYMYPLSEDIVPKSIEYNRLIDAMDECSVNVVNPSIPSEINIGDMDLEFISPLKSYDNTNDSSLVVRLTYKNNSFLFTGDISKKAESDLLNFGVHLDCDVLKVSHHGSKTSSSEEFLKKASPQISVVSVGTGDRFSPDYTTMAVINSFSDEVYRTDTDKTIVITSDGDSLNVKTHA